MAFPIADRTCRSNRRSARKWHEVSRTYVSSGGVTYTVTACGEQFGPGDARMSHGPSEVNCSDCLKERRRKTELEKDCDAMSAAAPGVLRWLGEPVDELGDTDPAPVGGAS